MIFLDDHHANHTAGRTIGRQEGLEGLGDRLAVDQALDRLPARGWRCPARQLILLARRTGAAGRGRAVWR